MGWIVFFLYHFSNRLFVDELFVLLNIVYYEIIQRKNNDPDIQLKESDIVTIHNESCVVKSLVRIVWQKLNNEYLEGILIVILRIVHRTTNN